MAVTDAMVLAARAEYGRSEDMALALEAAAAAAPQELSGEDSVDPEECPACDTPLDKCSRDNVCCWACNHAAGWVPASTTPVQVDEAELASLFQEHRPSQWRSFANDTIVYRCCGQDFGRLTGKPRKTDRDPRELWEEHMASKLAESLRGGEE